MQDHFVELSELFFATRQLIRRELPIKSDPNGWSRSEILRYVSESDTAPTMQEIADFLRITAPSATSLVSYLERKKLIKKVRLSGDRRNVHIEITAEGKAALKQYILRSRKILSQVFSKLDSTEIHTLVQILRKLQYAHLTHRPDKVVPGVKK